MILWDILEEHLNEAAFLWGQWERSLRSPRYVLREVMDGPEERLLAHVEGLCEGGLPVVERLLLPALQEEEDDLSREEVIEEIRGLEPQQQAELVALMWLGREDGEPEEWDDLVKRAIERREVPTESYLLDHPLLAEHWLDGMERLGLGGLVGGGE